MTIIPTKAWYTKTFTYAPSTGAIFGLMMASELPVWVTMLATLLLGLIAVRSIPEWRRLNVGKFFRGLENHKKNLAFSSLFGFFIAGYYLTMTISWWIVHREYGIALTGIPVLLCGSIWSLYTYRKAINFFAE
jgi:hypothetical protein